MTSTNKRLILGSAFIVGGNLLFITHAWIYWMPWSASFKATMFTIFFFTPEVATLIGVALMGKENYERFKKIVFRFIGRIKPAGDIGKLRHQIGLAMLFVPLIPTYLQAFKPEWFPDSSPWRWKVKVIADIIFIAGLFVLGGDFWDKLGALFDHKARAAKPEPPPNENVQT